MEYITVLALTFIISVSVMVLFFLILAIRGGKRGNIEYLIIQTYLGAKRPVRQRGLVTLDNIEHMALFKIFGKTGQEEIGTFHQKYLLPFQKGFLMLLDQYEIGRYRPLEISDEIISDYIETTETDFLGQPALDKDGNPIKTKKDIGKRKIKTINNEDFDFIIGTRTRLKDKLLKKEKKKTFWRTLAAVAVYFFLFLSVAFNAYYNYETHKENMAMIESQSEAKVAEQVTTTILNVLMNQTIKDVVKSVPRSPTG